MGYCLNLKMQIKHISRDERTVSLGLKTSNGDENLSVDNILLGSLVNRFLNTENKMM